MININNKKNGYTIIELLVSVSLFIVISAIASSLVITLLDSANVDNANRELSNNISTTFDNMIREIRSGTNYQGGDTSFSFNHENLGNVSYFINENNLYVSYPGSTINLTPNADVTIKKLKFNLRGQLPDSRNNGDNEQPVVSIYLHVSQRVGNQNEVNLHYQSTVAQRLLDFNI